MKRVTMMMLLLLMTVMGMQAQSLVGTWKTDLEVGKNGEIEMLFATFHHNGKVELKMDMAESDKDGTSIEFCVTIPGTYVRNDNKLTITIDFKNISIKVKKFKLDPEMEKMMAENPEMKKEVDEVLKTTIDKEVKQQFADEVPFDGDLTIKKLTADILELDDEGDTKEFKRVK